MLRGLRAVGAGQVNKVDQRVAGYLLDLDEMDVRRLPVCRSTRQVFQCGVVVRQENPAGLCAGRRKRVAGKRRRQANFTRTFAVVLEALPVHLNSKAPERESQGPFLF